MCERRFDLRWTRSLWQQSRRKRLFFLSKHEKQLIWNLINLNYSFFFIPNSHIYSYSTLSLSLPIRLLSTWAVASNVAKVNHIYGLVGSCQNSIKSNEMLSRTSTVSKPKFLLSKQCHHHKPIKFDHLPSQTRFVS